VWSGGSRLDRLPFPLPLALGLAAGLDASVVAVVDVVGASDVDSGGCVSVLVAITG